MDMCALEISNVNIIIIIYKKITLHSDFHSTASTSAAGGGAGDNNGVMQLQTTNQVQQGTNLFFSLSFFLLFQIWLYLPELI